MQAIVRRAAGMLNVPCDEGGVEEVGRRARGTPRVALRLLRRYERWRKSENESLALALSLLNRFLAFGDGELGRWAEQGMGWVGRSAALRRPFAERALGLSGELPQVARRA